jgi:hypothetical protein
MLVMSACDSGSSPLSGLPWTPGNGHSGDNNGSGPSGSPSPGNSGNSGNGGSNNTGDPGSPGNPGSPGSPGYDAGPGAPGSPGSDAAATPPPPANGPFETTVEPILLQYCSECHHAGKTIDLTTYPFNSGNQAELVAQAISDMTSGHMPPTPRDPVPASSIAIIQQWASSGMNP